MALEDVLAGCIDKWRRQGIPLRPPLDEAEICRLWGRFGQQVSEDVLGLYTGVGGFGDGHYDEDFFWFLWPLPWLEEENAHSPSDGIKFCDHSINLVTWEMRYEDERRSSVWEVLDHRPGWSRMTAPSLEAFFRVYLKNPWQLL